MEILLNYDATSIYSVLVKLMYTIISITAIKYFSDFCIKANRHWSNILLLGIITIILLLFKITIVFNHYGG